MQCVSVDSSSKHCFRKLAHKRQPIKTFLIAFVSDGCNVRLVHGTLYNPLTRIWSWTSCQDVTYALHAVKSSG